MVIISKMDVKSIVEYIKKNYPKIVFEPIQFEKSLTRALGFIITEDKLIIGFINKNGVMCKLIKPVDLNQLSNSTFVKVISSLPIVKGFTEKDRERIMRLFSVEESVDKAVDKNIVSKEENDLVVKELNKKIKRLESDLKIKQDEYDIFFDSQTNKVLLIEKEYQKKLDEIRKQYEEQLSNVQQCKMQLVDQNQSIINGINKYKEEIKDYIKGKEMEVGELKELYDKSVDETKILQNKLNQLLENETKRLEDLEKNKDMLSESDLKISERESEIIKLKENIKIINDELEDLRKSLSKSEMKAVLLTGYKERCRNKILKEKEEIIKAIKEYNEKWLNWSGNVKSNVNDYKIKILSELKIVKKNLEDSFIKNDLDEKEIKRLKQNMFDIENELKTTISNQLTELSGKEEIIKRLEQERIQMELDREKQLSDAKLSSESEIKSYQEMISVNENTINENKKTISELRDELDKLRLMLEQNESVKIETVVDYENCYLIVKNFVALNNIFYRKLEVIDKLKDIINNNIGVFTHLNETIKTKIKNDFQKVRDEILVHINFLNLSEYMSSPNIQYLKNKSTREYVPESFCKELTNLLDYWNLNQNKYREQDKILTNIYEDLSGAIRVFVRIKPLIGNEQKMDTILIEQVDNKKQKLLTIGCVDSVKKTFGEFYGIFEDTYTNLDVYTGELESTKYNTSKTKVDLGSISSDSVSPGLYSSFSQVENGYSIVLFGYGISGSGKTLTLLGNKGVPGVLHYGLDNLQNVSNIKLKYLFEQYYNLVNINFNKLTGKIHNLINKVPQLKEFSKDETEIFKKEIPSYIDTNNLKIEDIYSLTDIIENYRKNNNRIKTTPNNPVSSRSHLYLVFEIEFKNGKTGYITIVDMAGKESPLDLYNTFIDTTKTKLASIMAPAPVGGEEKISATMRQDLVDSYSPKSVFEILKESFYINESINHLIYYFNKKNYRQYPVALQSQNSEKYDTLKYYIKPEEEEKTINTSNNCLMIPILKFLENLSNKNKKEDEWLPTKFITICNIRQEELYCEQTFKTLEFAQSIKSS
jgi:hypothetical protein